MSYGDTGPAFTWTDSQVRHPNKWTIIPYLHNSVVTADIVVAFSEPAMQTAYGRMQELGKKTLCYDQIVVTTNKEAVPSAGDSGPVGDMI